MRTESVLNSRRILLRKHARKPAEVILVVAKREQYLGRRELTGDRELDLAHAESPTAHHLLNELLGDHDLPRFGLAIPLANDEVQAGLMILAVTKDSPRCWMLVVPGGNRHWMDPG